MYKEDNYFEHIVNNLKLDDFGVLGRLYDNDATIPFKAMSKKTVIEQTKMSEANLRKTLYRLEAVDFVRAVTGCKEHKIYLTGYGLLAMQETFQDELESEEA
jgi:RIO-like serine/threonine protein kinase